MLHTISIRHFLKRSACGLLLLLPTWACHREDTTILPADVQLQAGDIVFRQGESVASHAVLSADRAGCYSHIGIVVDSCGQPMIVHAVPDEHDFEGDFDRIKMDRPDEFFLQSRAAIGEVMRPKAGLHAQQAAETALRLYRQKLPFDHEYDDSDSTEMYCTELILYAFHSVDVDLATGPRDHFNFPIDFDGYLPSAIHASPLLESIRIF